MNDNIKAGADIHSGDGGYSEGTTEDYQEFVKIRNKSLAEARIKELAYQAYNHDTMIGFHYIPDEFKTKFAELIINECVGEIRKQDDDESLHDWDRGYEAGLISAINALHKHFGVDE